jgi:glycosyltransferase involved in cell wall biosynthesis
MVTVVIPLYNREDTIGRALISVINQTYQDIEIIIVDDCSDDRSVEIVESFNDSRLHIIKLNSNVGASSARNIGINAAKGELIAFQDSDDEWYPEKLSIQIQALLDTKSDVVASKYQQINQNGKQRIIPTEDIADINIPNRILMGNFIGTPTLLCKKSCFTEDLFDPRLPRLQDWDLLIALSRKYDIHFINEVLVDAYLQKNSISIDNNKLEKALEMIFAKYDK